MQPILGCDGVILLLYFFNGGAFVACPYCVFIVILLLWHGEKVRTVVVSMGGVQTARYINCCIKIIS